MGPSPDFYCLACDVFDVEPHRHVVLRVGQVWRHRSGAIRTVTFVERPVTLLMDGSVVGHAVMSFVDGSAAATHSSMEWRWIRGGAHIVADPDWTLLTETTR